MWLTILWIVLGLYFLFWVLFYFLQHFAFFRPEVLPSSFSYDYSFPFEEMHFDMEDGGSINGIYFKVPNSLGVVYFLKGNSRSIKGWAKFAKDYVGKGYDFFLIDYRGFGKSKGRRTEQKLYSDSQYVYKWLKERYDENKIVILGRSFGSGIAARIASWNNPKMLILDSPYYSFVSLIKSYARFFIPVDWLLRYKIPTNEFIKKVKCPIHIIHGTKDRLIPFHHGRRLHEEKKDNSTLHAINGGRHNNLPEFEQFHTHLYEILTGKN